MENLVCETCWIAVGDMTKHQWEEHGVQPSDDDLARLARQRAEFDKSLSGLDIEMEYISKKEFGGSHK